MFLFIGVVDDVLQGTLDTGKETVQDYIIYVIQVCVPDLRATVGLEEFQVLLYQRVDTVSSSFDVVIVNLLEAFTILLKKTKSHYCAKNIYM